VVLLRPAPRPLAALILGLLLPLHFSLGSVDSALAQEPPNVVLIIGDDVGWTDFGFMESPRTLQTNQGVMPIQDVVRTPNLDALAASGVVFRNGQATSSSCLPSLRTLLSAGGLHSFQWEAMRQDLELVPGIGPIPDRTEVRYYRTLPRELGRLGCRSWEGGKMWEGTYATAGFTHGLATAIGDPLHPVGDDFGRTGWDPAACGATAAPGAACPALAPLRDFLDEVQGSCFFAWFAPKLPHFPYNATQIYRQHYEDLGLQSEEVDYLANVSWFDDVVGELVSELEDRNLRNDTLIIYVSDNGWGLGYQIISGQGRGKGTLYDLGLRTPVIFQWPGHVPAGVVHDDLVSMSDIVPTIYDYVGADAVPEQQGVSLRSRVEGGPPLGRTELIGSLEGLGSFARTDTWRYLHFTSDGHEELYRIDLDPFEQTDLAAANPDLVATFAAHVDEWIVDRMTPPDRVEISGRVTDRATGAPPVGSRLEIAGTHLNAIVGPDGSFRIGPLPRDLYLLRSDGKLGDVEGLGSTDLIPLPPSLLARGLHVPVLATAPRPVPGVFGARLEGRLATATGVPLGGQTVKVSGHVGGRIVTVSTLTQPDGTYRAENLAAGTYHVTATVPRGYRRVAVRNVQVDASHPALLDLTAESR